MTSADPNLTPDPHADRSDVERLLASFAPRPARLDRDRTLFLAGQAAAATLLAPTIEAVEVRVPWYWPASTVATSLVATVLAVLLVVRGDSTSRAAPSPVAGQAQPTPVDPPPSITVAPAPEYLQPTSSEWPEGSFLRLRELALDQGVESLPRPRGSTDPRETPTTYAQALQSAIERPNSLTLGLRY